LWQRAKLQFDTDYRENQRAAQQAWARRNPDYWHNRRQRSIPEGYEAVEAPPQQSSGVVMGPVKMDVCRLPPGLYRIWPRQRSRSRRNDSWLVQITPVRVRRIRKMDLSREDLIDKRRVES
jgi:hypothetical protein